MVGGGGVDFLVIVLCLNLMIYENFSKKKKEKKHKMKSPKAKDMRSPSPGARKRYRDILLFLNTTEFSLH